MFDLLNERKKLSILEDAKKRVCVVGLKVRDIDMVFFGSASLCAVSALIMQFQCMSYKGTPACLQQPVTVLLKQLPCSPTFSISWSLA